MDKSAGYVRITIPVTVGGRVFNIGDVIEICGQPLSPYHRFTKNGCLFWLFGDGSYRRDEISVLDCYMPGERIWKPASPLEALACVTEMDDEIDDLELESPNFTPKELKEFRDRGYTKTGRTNNSEIEETLS